MEMVMTREKKWTPLSNFFNLPVEKWQKKKKKKHQKMHIEMKTFASF